MKTNKFTLLLLICSGLMTIPIFAESEVGLPVEMNAGEFENGMNYLIQSPNDRENGIFVEMNIPVPFNQENKFVFHLLEHSMFYHTFTLNRFDVTTELSELGFDTNIDSNVIFNEWQQGLHFSLLDKSPNALLRLFALLKQVVFYPILSDESIEIARIHLLETLTLTEEERLQLQTITPNEVRESYEKWVKSPSLLLSISGSCPSEMVLPALIDTFGFVAINHLVEFNTPEEIQETLNCGSPAYDNADIQLERINEHLERSADGETYIIDKKIFMRGVTGLQSEKTAQKIGVYLLITSLAITSAAIGAFFLLPVAAAPIIGLTLAGTAAVTAIPGSIYYFSSGYINDPYYIAKARTEDLQKGFSHAYSLGRVQYTLTPMERREVLIKEMRSPPIGKSSLNLLMNVYQFSNPLIYQLFTDGEYHDLKGFRDLYINASLHNNTLKENIKRQLIALCAPYGAIRDQSVEMAKYKYESHVATITYKTILKNYEADKKIIYEMLISPEERSLRLEELKMNTDAMKAVVENDHGLALKEFELDKASAQYLYSQAVNTLKTVMDYDNTLAQINMASGTIDQYYNERLKQWFWLLPLNVNFLSDTISRI